VTKRRSAKQKSIARRWFWRAIGLCFVAGLLGSIVAAGYLWHLDQQITKIFEGRRWSVPAQVYAQPLELYAGMELSQTELVRELQRVGYQRQGTLDVPGTFNLSGNTLRAYLRGFEFMDGYRKSVQLEAGFGTAVAGGNKKSLLQTLLTDNEAAAIVQIEPASIGSFFPSHGEDRLILAPQQVPPLLREGLKLVEDKSFDKHHGFDLRGIIRAVVVNLKAGEKRQGGSTLTQQLVKSYFLDNRRTYGRKLRELGMAIILDARFEKADLLNAYINEIYLAQDGSRAIHGFGLGSQFYFNKPLVELGTHEIALLLTVIRGPSYYNPWRQGDRARERRDRIIKTLHDGGLISASQASSAVQRDLSLAGTARPRGAYYPAFMDLVRQQLDSSYDPDDLATTGLRIFTTLRPHMQERLEASAATTLERLEPQQPARDRAEEPALQVAAVVTQTQTGDVLALLGGRERGGYNRAVKAQRPIGSLIKPVVYLTALEEPDYHLGTSLQDTAIEVPRPGGKSWTPSNFDNIEHGTVPLVRGLADSLNLATVHLGLQLGVDKIATRVRQLLPTSRPNPYPSLLLGAVDMNVLQVSELYGNFASGGFQAQPKAVIAVLDENNTPLSRFPLLTDKSIDSLAIVQLTEAMRIAMQRGTGKSSRLSKAGVAGKTGTSNDYRDSWFAGFDASTLAVVWVGFDDNTPTGLTGASGALKVWDAFMSESRVNPIPRAIANGAAGGLMRQWVEYDSGLRTTLDCSDEANIIELAMPSSTELPVKPGCSVRNPGSVAEALGDRLRRWLRSD